MTHESANARIYATARADAMETALATGSADAVMAVYRQICADGHQDAADDLMRRVIVAGLRALAEEQ